VGVFKFNLKNMYFADAIKAHQNFDFETARTNYLLELSSGDGSNTFASLFNVGVIDMNEKNFTSAICFFERALALNQKDIDTILNLAICCELEGDWGRAEFFYRLAYGVDSKQINVLNNFAAALSKHGNHAEAVNFFEKALCLEPNNISILINLGIALREVGKHKESLIYLDRAVKISPNSAIALSHNAIALMELGLYDESLTKSNKAIEADLTCALGYLAKGFTQHKRQDFSSAINNYKKALDCDPFLQIAQINIAQLKISQVNDEAEFGSALEESKRSNEMTTKERYSDLGIKKPVLAVPFFKLKHDIEQANFLKSKGIISNSLLRFTEATDSVYGAADIKPSQFKNDGQQQVMLNGELVEAYRKYQIDQLIYEMPKINGILHHQHDWRAIEESYFSSDPELIFIDDFLDLDALNAFQNFCFFSKVWTKEYKGCYLGAFANQGFISPLHLKLALDLKKAMPRVFKDYPIGQLWGFKYDSQLGKGINVHADFAKVNLNFWITPSESNLDPNSGGLRVYTVPAPITWTFHDYNRDSEQIYDFLSRKNSSSITVPYKGNRAVLFNSALFHETDVINFKEGYENRRVNMTYLFGSQLA